MCNIIQTFILESISYCIVSFIINLSLWVHHRCRTIKSFSDNNNNDEEIA